MVNLANADKSKNRIVPSFPFYRWNEIDPLLFIPEKNVSIIKNKLNNFVDFVSGFQALLNSSQINKIEFISSINEAKN